MAQILIRVVSIIVASVIVTASPFAANAQQRQMTAADTLRVANISDAQISRNGQWVVYTVFTVEGDETIDTLWLARSHAPLVREGRMKDV
jgi:hypothetical protein